MAVGDTLLEVVARTGMRVTAIRVGPAPSEARAPKRTTRGAYCRKTESFRLPLREIPMSDKSPRQGMSKKSGKSIKEKRAEKRSKGSEETFSDKIHPSKKR